MAIRPDDAFLRHVDEIDDQNGFRLGRIAQELNNLEVEYAQRIHFRTVMISLRANLCTTANHYVAQFWFLRDCDYRIENPWERTPQGPISAKRCLIDELPHRPSGSANNGMFSDPGDYPLSLVRRRLARTVACPYVRGEKRAQHETYLVLGCYDQMGPKDGFHQDYRVLYALCLDCRRAEKVICSMKLEPRAVGTEVSRSGPRQVLVSTG